MNGPQIGVIITLIVAVIFLVSGCASKGVATRTVPDASTANPGKSWYIESNQVTNKPRYSCSFVEFDERGDYLNFQQQRDSWQKIKEIANHQKQKLLLVIYCHGWKNNAQSVNVVEFVNFLGKLAASEEARANNLRIHGLYLSWRGNVLEPYVDESSTPYLETTADFGGPIINGKYYRTFFYPMCIPEVFTYWSRKGQAENKVSTVPLARTIFEAANAAKQYSQPGWTNRVIVMGHSFGALMLEKSLGQACVGAMANSWQWGDEKLAQADVDKIPSATTDVLPFDCILFVNSAAPSIYAKSLSDFFWANQSARNSKTPIVISVTSSADWATKVAHRWANVLAPFYPSLQRKYTEGVLDKTNVPVPQAYFYEHTPGHNPLLVDHWIVKKTMLADAPTNSFESVLEANLNPYTKDVNVFYTHSKDGITAWEIGTNACPAGWSQYNGFSPVKRGNYWIVRCDGDLIASHTAIWTPTTMEMYAALYRLTYAR